MKNIQLSSIIHHVNGAKAVTNPFSLHSLKCDILYSEKTGHFPIPEMLIKDITFCIEPNQYKYLVDDNDNFVRIIKIV